MKTQDSEGCGVKSPGCLPLPLAQAGGAMAEGAMAEGAGRVQALCSGFSNLCVASSSVGVSRAAAPEPQL